MIDLSIDITMRQGEFVLTVRDRASVEVLGVLGPSGSGKTSLLESIAGIRTPDEGEIRIGDRILFSSAGNIDLPARDRRIGYVPQDALLFPNMNVRANINFGRHAEGDFESLVKILDLQDLLERRVHELVRRGKAARRDRESADDTAVDPATRRAARRRRSRASRRDPAVYPSDPQRAARAADLRHARRSGTEFDCGSSVAPRSVECGLPAPRFLARDYRPRPPRLAPTRRRVAAILSEHGKPHLLRRIARLRCDARFRFSVWTARNRACNTSQSTRFR